jgi:hypothetical protein
LLERFNLSQSCSELSANRIALEVPGNVLSDVSAGTLFRLEELNQ